jgi:hypothetical protein
MSSEEDPRLLSDRIRRDRLDGWSCRLCLGHLLGHLLGQPFVKRREWISVEQQHDCKREVEPTSVSLEAALAQLAKQGMAHNNLSGQYIVVNVNG